MNVMYVLPPPADVAAPLMPKNREGFISLFKTLRFFQSRGTLHREWHYQVDDQR